MLGGYTVFMQGLPRLLRAPLGRAQLAPARLGSGVRLAMYEIGVYGVRPRLGDLPTAAHARSAGGCKCKRVLAT